MSRAGALAIELSAYLIVREALTNALKHAPRGPHRRDPPLQPDEVQMVVRDDGVRPATGSEPGSGLAGGREGWRSTAA